MTGHDDFDRTLGDWLEAEALSPVPTGGLERCRGRHPCADASSGLALAVGSDWVGAATDADARSVGARLALERAGGRWLVAARGDHGDRWRGGPCRCPLSTAIAVADRPSRPPCLWP